MRQVLGTGRSSQAERWRPREVLIVWTRVDPVMWGTLQRSDYKSELI